MSDDHNHSVSFHSGSNFCYINDNSPGGGVADRLHYTANVGSSPFLTRRRKKDNIESRNIVKLRQGSGMDRQGMALKAKGHKA